MALSFCAFAQDKKKDRLEMSVYFSVKDHLTHDGIDSTLTAKLLNAADSTFIDTMKVDVSKWDGKRYSYVEGKVKQAGDYLIRLDAEGYQPKFVELKIPKLYKREKYMELKTQYMRQQKKKLDVELDELVVTATKLKFYMDGDTLVYNADAFNLSEGSMIDALIRKLPGVELKEGGEIFVNGQKVEALLLNGKDFFDSDRELMLENMPAYMVKNIQSYERVPEEVKGTNREKTTKKELVMNVKLKREYNQGWMMNVEGGAGTTFYKNENGNLDAKFMGRLFTMRYSDRSRFMLYANANNLNDDRTPGEKGEWSPLTQSQGLTETYKMGTDYSVGSWEHMRYHGSASMAYKEKDDANHVNSETFLEGGNTFGRSFYNKKSYDLSFDTNHEFMYRTREPKDWYKSFMVHNTPRFNYLKWNNHSASASTTLEQDVAEQWGKAWMDSLAAPDAGELLRKHAITRSINRTKGVGHYTKFSDYGYLSFSPAHNDMIDFSLNFNLNFTNREEDNYDINRVDFPNNPLAQTDFRNRYTPSFNRTDYVSVNPRIRMALNDSKKLVHQLDLSYGYNYNYQNSNNSLYLLNKLKDWDEKGTNPLGTLPSMDELLSTLDADNSTRSKSVSHTHTPQVGYELVFDPANEDQYTFLSFSLQMTNNRETLDYWQGSQADTVFSRNTTFLKPSIRFYHNNWKERKSMQAYYGMSTSAPSMTSLLNIKNTANPLFVSMGNPNLRNTRTHNFDASYEDKFGRGTLFNIRGNASIVENAVASGQVFNRETGVTTAMPDNVNGNWSMELSTGIDMPLDSLEKWRMRNNVSYNYNHSVDLSGETSSQLGNLLNATRSVVGSQNVNERLEITYRPNGKMEFSAKGNIHYQHSTSDRRNFNAINVCDFDYGATAQMELPWNMQLSTDLTMYSRRGYSDSSMNTNELVWNARVTKRMMKGNLLVHLDGFDLLGKLSNIRRSINAQGRTETFYNVIPSYCLLHIAWKMNAKPKKKG